MISVELAGKVKSLLVGRGLNFCTYLCLECPLTEEGPLRELINSCCQSLESQEVEAWCLCIEALQPDNSLCWRGHVASHVTRGCILLGSLPICSLGSFWVIRHQSKSSQAASFMARDYER